MPSTEYPLILQKCIKYTACTVWYKPDSSASHWDISHHPSVDYFPITSQDFPRLVGQCKKYRFLITYVTLIHGNIIKHSNVIVVIVINTELKKKNRVVNVTKVSLSKDEHTPNSIHLGTITIGTIWKVQPKVQAGPGNTELNTNDRISLIVPTNQFSCHTVDFRNVQKFPHGSHSFSP